MTEFPSAQTPPPVKNKQKFPRWIIVIVALLCSCFCLCVGYFVVSTIYQAQTNASLIEEITPTLDDYMHKLSSRDFQGASALFIPEKQQGAEQSALKMTNEFIDALKGYQNLTIQNFRLVVRVDPLVRPKAIASGIIIFDDGAAGSFDASLQKVDDKWMIDSFSIVVPPEIFLK